MKTQISKLSLSIAITLLIATFSVTPVSAVNVLPNSGSYTAGSTRTFQIVAAPTAAGQNAVSIRLNVTGMTITSFTDPSGFIGVTSDCSGGTKFTTNQICVSMAKTADIQAGDPLGTFTATIGTSGTATVVKATGTLYSDGTTTAASTGTAGTYTITPAGGTPTPTPAPTPTPTQLPNTAVQESNILLVVLGAFFVSLGALSFVSIDSLRTYKRN